MKMDIACPVELMRFERADFGGERRQAYLTLRNEGAYVITALSGRLMLLDGKGRQIEDRRVSFGAIQAPGGETFTCHLALDDFPDFDTATLLVEDVVFEGAEPWALHPMRLKEYPDPVPAEGAERIALTAVAGADALCFPRAHDNLWLCVCGRYNRWRWTACKRCRRERDMVISAYTREGVQAAYARQVEEARRAPPEVIVPGAPRRVAPAPVRPAPPTAPGGKKPRRGARGQARALAAAPGSQSWLVVILCAVVVMLALWGVMSLVRRLPGRESASPERPAQEEPLVVITPDYLEPL